MKTGIHLAESENDTPIPKERMPEQESQFFALISESTAQPDIGVRQVAA
jgi:hypothetical protein